MDRPQLVVELPKHSAVLHDTTCWSEAAWDVRPSRYATQLWRLKTTSALRPQPEVCLAEMKRRMGVRGQCGYSLRGAPPPRLQYYRQHQQDALRYSWDGLIAGNNRSFDEETERIGGGYVVGVDSIPTMTLSIRVPPRLLTMPNLCLHVGLDADVVSTNPVLHLTLQAHLSDSVFRVPDIPHSPGHTCT
jgi:hypothetical protein